MKVLLLDVFNRLNEKVDNKFFSTFSTNLMRRYDGNGLLPLPTLQEFDLVLTDFMNTFENQNRERQDKLQHIETTTGQPQPKSVLHFNQAGEHVFDYAQQHIAPQLHHALSDGIPVVVIAGKWLQNEETSNYAWLMELYPTLNVLDARPETGPATIKCVSSDHAVNMLNQTFQNYLTWEVAVNNPIELLQQVARPGWFRRKQQSKAELPTWEPLFVNAKKQTVAFVLPVGKSELIVLPNVRDVEIRYDYVQHILTEFLPSFRPTWFPEQWAGSYVPESLHHQLNSLREKKERVIKEMEQCEQALGDKVQTLRTYIDLVTQNGDRLVNTVESMFSALFGRSKISTLAAIVMASRGYLIW